MPTDDGEQPFPPVPLALLQALEARFPDRCPEPTSSERGIWMAVGAVEVTRLLRRMWEDQNEAIITEKVT